MKKVRFSSFGFSSILLIFVMICIVTFATLTLVTANSDYKLSKKVAAKSTSYYEGEEFVYRRMEEIDNACMDAYLQAANANAFYTKMNLLDSHEVCITYSVSENQYLEVILEITYPSSDTEHFMDIKKWQLINVPMEIEDTGWNLIGE